MEHFGFEILTIVMTVGGSIGGALLVMKLNEIRTKNQLTEDSRDSIRSPTTQRRYKNLLYTFLKLIPNQLYIDSLGNTPKDSLFNLH